ncbi:hypothetical protein GCM10027068_30530 [Prescottella soli]
MPSDTGGAEAEPGSDVGGRDRPLLEEQLHHRGAGVPFVRAGNGQRRTRGDLNRFVTCTFSARASGRFRFHNTSVTEFDAPVYEGCPL